MRSDKKLDSSVLSSQAWDRDLVTGKKSDELRRFELPSLKRGKMSFSGNERNHLFVNEGGRKFIDISGISGLDSPQDGRSFAVWDYDRDGWQDIALTNINTPVLSLYRNQMGTTGKGMNERQNMLALTFVGGNATAKPSDRYGSRDGYGVKATVSLPDQTLIREHRCGEGLGAQNTNYMLFGLGKHDVADSITIQWPSGISQQIENVRAGDLVTIYENASESSNGSGFERSRYIVDGPPHKHALGNGLRDEQFLPPTKPAGDLGMYTSMATWCANCNKQLPQLNLLREHFSAEQLNMFGVPVDDKETVQELVDYVAEKRPPYDLGEPWNPEQRESFNQLINKHFGSDLLPATIFTSHDGTVLEIIPGVPTISETNRLLLSIASRETKKETSHTDADGR